RQVDNLPHGERQVADVPPQAPEARAWLGSAVAIKDPTSALFLRQNGSNLLIVGHREEAALGVLAAAMISLAAECRGLGTSVPSNTTGSTAKFYILDGTRADAPEAGYWNRLAAAIPGVKQAGVRDAASLVAEIAAELAARQQQAHDDHAPIFLFIYNLGRFRDLRKEDEYGFSSDDQPASPAKQFADILREGPPLGIHTLVWCDTYSNVTRILDRRNMQDFEMRILFQMNGNDSSSLMDTPEAAKLGVHRAILYDEGQGTSEKFRPYGLPSNEYLASLAQQLAPYSSRST
ncbi:MAG: hypothetical protein ABFC96_04310, partial [Thermoguttaceae bacterium]